MLNNLGVLVQSKLINGAQNSKTGWVQQCTLVFAFYSCILAPTKYFSQKCGVFTTHPPLVCQVDLLQVAKNVLCQR